MHSKTDHANAGHHSIGAGEFRVVKGRTVTTVVRMTPDLIHLRTRREFREFCSGWGVLRTIESAFEVEGFEQGVPADSGGMRRSLFDTYANVIDWGDPEQVRRALHVFEEMLSWAWNSDNRRDAVRSIRRCLDRDGYLIDEQGAIRPKVGAVLAELPLGQLRDPRAIEEHLLRLENAGDADPALTISSAKALIEATSKLVLDHLGESYNEKADISELVRVVQRALKVHPDTIAPSKKGRETIVRTLSNLSQVAVGVAELRNEYGPDHGRSRSTAGLKPRHAHLALGSAATYCRFLLETLAARRAHPSQQLAAQLEIPVS